MIRNVNNKQDGGRDQHLPIDLGQVVMTRAAMEVMDACGGHMMIAAVLLVRHRAGDWGLICEEDWALNDDALTHGGRLMSAYDLPDGTRIWVITEWDRSTTTILLPADY